MQVIFLFPFSAHSTPTSFLPAFSRFSLPLSGLGFPHPFSYDLHLPSSNPHGDSRREPQSSTLPPHPHPKRLIQRRYPREHQSRGDRAGRGWEGRVAYCETEWWQGDQGEAGGKSFLLSLTNRCRATLMSEPFPSFLPLFLPFLLPFFYAPVVSGRSRRSPLPRP
jgi:hypothetical protein